MAKALTLRMLHPVRTVRIGAALRRLELEVDPKAPRAALTTWATDAVIHEGRAERGERVGEQDTKAILIEPVLAALGWELGDLDDVRREYRRKAQDNPVDYALLVFGRPLLFIEAKALGAALSHRRCASQVLAYASIVGVGWCLLTDGDEYRLYNSHAPVDVEEKLFRTVRVSDDDQAQFCLETLELLDKERMGESELESLWKSQFIDRRVRVALEDLFSTEDPALIRLIHKKTPELAPAELRESMRRATIGVHFPEVSLAPVTPGPATVSEPVPSPPGGEPKPPVRVGVELTDLIDAGLIVPPLELEKRYKGVSLEATIAQSGQVVWDGASYDSPSTAAGMARKSVIGAPEGRAYPQTNGWAFWQYHDPKTGRLCYIDDLRQQYLEQRT